MIGGAGKRAMKTKETKPYEKPSIRTYTEDEIMELIGPANTSSMSFGDMHGGLNGSIHSNGNGHAYGRGH
jgi:hypothetical protein